MANVTISGLTTNASPLSTDLYPQDTALGTTGKVTTNALVGSALAILTGKAVAVLADAAIIGGIPVIHMVNTAGGATANTDVVLTYKTRVLYVIVVNRGLGTVGDTITLKNGTTNAITNAIDISGADKTVALVGTIDDAQWDIAASGTLRITETDGGGNDSPATTVIVLGVRVA